MTHSHRSILMAPVMACAVASAMATLAAPAMAATAAKSPLSVYDFNAGWRLVTGDPSGAAAPGFNDAAWKPVTLPHAWNEDEAFKKDIADLSTGIAWYRKHFTLPAGALGAKDGGKVFLEFEGVRQAGEVFVNGKRLALSENGISAFGVDISDAVTAGDNVIAVRTDNAWDYRQQSNNQRYQWSDKNFNVNYGGIQKNVRLHIKGKLYQTLPLYSSLGTTGVYVYADQFDIPARAATLHAESQVRNDSAEARSFAYEVQVRDRDGKQVASFTGPATTLAAGATTIVKADARVAGLNFWSWGYGYLYDVSTVLKVDGRAVDQVNTRTGFRKTEFGQGMVKLNDRVMQMHGYAQRTSNEWPAVGMSVPAWLSDYSNRLIVEGNGNLVRWMHITPWKQDVESLDRVGLLQAMPAGDSEADVTGARWDQRLAVMADSIIYNRNNPSIVFYESGNKGVSEEHMREMKALRDQYDPHGGRASGSREMLASQVAEYGGEMLYVNKSARLPFWAMEYSRDEALRKYWDNLSPPYHKDGAGPQYKGADAAIYNRNQDSHAIEDVLRWYDYWRERPGTGTRVSSGGVNIVFSDTNTHHRGEENYRRSGEVDAMRIAKDGYWAHQVIWDGWVDIEQPRAYIIGHWNYTPGASKTVTVVSSAESVELFLNGRSLGRGARSANFLHAFADVKWEAGELKAVGYDAAGKRLCDTTLQTAGAPVALRLNVRTAPSGLRADGADLALVEVEAVDAAGRRNPVALNMVDFKLSGPAEWRGGIAQGPDNYILASSLPVEGGVNRVLVRSTTKAGKIVLRASADGLKAATLELTSQPVQTAGGLGANIPADALPSYLGRGPTPATPSFKVSRVAVDIASATAGSNATDAGKSYDDNEISNWSSAPGEPAWISYQLARAATLTEATFKLPGWRERSYPIRITVDGQEVYKGDTPKSYGYVTLPFKPVHGSVVRVELVGVATESDSLKLIEVANQKNTDTGANRLGKGVLAITEVEFYEAPSATAASGRLKQVSDLWGDHGERWSPGGRLPDFSYAGYHHSEQAIPKYPQAANVKDYGAKGDGASDDTQAFKDAIAATNKGAIFIPAGRYVITDFIYLRKSGVVLRGAGPDKTILVFPKSLEEVTPKASHTSSGTPTLAYSFDYGFLTLVGEPGKRVLATIASNAKRGDSEVELDNARALAVGQSIQIRVQEDQEQTLKTFLYAGDPGDIKKGKNLDTRMVVKVTAISGNKITIDRPLRFDTRKNWQPEVLAFEPSVTESGIEDLRMEFPDVPYLGHFKERGFNAIELRGVVNCWVSNVWLHNADMGVLMAGNANFNTIDGVTISAYDHRGALDGHHAFQAKQSQDNVISHFDLQAKFVHDLSVEHASGNVYADGKGADLSLDHHKDSPYENLYTNLNAGAGKRIWTSGGGNSLGRHSAAWATFWNIRADRPLVLPPAGFAPALVNLVALDTTTASLKDKTGAWIESLPPAQIFPENIWRAQLKKRLAGP